MDTATSKLFIGLDVHKRQWSVSIFTERLHHKTFSQPPRACSLKGYLDQYFPDHQVICAYEAGKFGYYIYRELTSYGYECLVVNPSDIPTTNKEVSEKTDRIDSRKIARALRSGLLRGIYVPGVEQEGHRQLFRYRKRLWGDLVRIKNRIKDKLINQGVEIPDRFDNPYWSHGFLNWLGGLTLPSAGSTCTLGHLLVQFRMVKRHFMDVSIDVRKLQRDTCYKQRAKLLRQVPGLGPLTTVQLLVEIGDIKRFPNFNHFNSYIGFKPMVYSSGDYDHKGHLTYRRHKSLRSAIIESAWTAVQRDPALTISYERLRKRHTAKRAIIIIARKLLSRIYRVLKTGEPYVVGITQ